MIKIIEKSQKLFLIETNNLIIEPFIISDAQRITELAGDIRVVELTASIPFPYELSLAHDWLKTHESSRIKDNNHIYAIKKKDQTLIGCINIAVNSQHEWGYIGYWIGHEYWGQGHCTEALNSILELGFRRLGIHKAWAEHKTFNIASGRVMEKVGMVHEGKKRDHFKKGGDFFDMSVKSILHKEFLNRK